MMDLALASVASWYLVGGVGRSLPEFLGAEDHRKYQYYGLAYARTERRLRFRSYRAELVWEGYYERSHSPGASEQPRNTTDAWGVLAYARYRLNRHLFFDLGWGAQYTDQRSVDLSSRLNSTPVFAVGLIVPHERHELMVGLRLLHVSNAGFSGNNQGLNNLGFFAQFRF